MVGPPTFLALRGVSPVLRAGPGPLRTLPESALTRCEVVRGESRPPAPTSGSPQRSGREAPISTPL